MKEQLLKTAVSLFHEFGYEKVSVAMICEKCGVTKGCFYYHYPSKDHLLLGYFPTMADEEMTDVMTEMLLLENNADKLWRIFQYYTEGSIALGPDLLKNLLKKDMDRNLLLFPLEMQTMKEMYPKFYRIIETLSMDGQQKGEICRSRPWTELWEDFAAAFLGVLTYWSSNDGDFDVAERMYRCFKMVYITLK